jgi:hypothetical protein
MTRKRSGGGRQSRREVVKYDSADCKAAAAQFPDRRPTCVRTNLEVGSISDLPVDVDHALDLLREGLDSGVDVRLRRLVEPLMFLSSSLAEFRHLGRKISGLNRRLEIGHGKAEDRAGPGGEPNARALQRDPTRRSR